MALSQEDVEEYLKHITVPQDAVRELIGAKARGAAIHQRLLEELVVAYGSETIWKDYVRLGKDEANWALKNYPEIVSTTYLQILWHVPEKVIPIMLNESIGNLENLNSRTDAPFRVLQDWIKAGDPVTGDDATNRELLLNATLSWMRDVEEPEVAVKAICLALSPLFESSNIAPGFGNKVIIRSGFVSPKVISFVNQNWARVSDFLSKKINKFPSEVLDLVNHWALWYPGKGKVPESQRKQMLALAKRMMGDLQENIDGQGIQAKVNRTLTRLNLPIKSKPSKLFHLLYEEPLDQRRLKNWPEKQGEKIKKIIDLKKRGNPEEIIAELADLDSQAKAAHLSDHYFPSYAYAELAKSVSDPEVWFSIAVKHKWNNWGLIKNLAERIAAEKTSFWNKWALANINSDIYEDLVIIITLRTENMDPGLIDTVFGKIQDKSRLIDRFARYPIPLEIARRLLTHSSEKVRSNAAGSEWFHQKDAGPRPEIKEEWESAVVHSASDEHEFELIFKARPDLAFKWLLKKLDNLDTSFYHIDRLTRVAIAGLTDSQRHQVIDALPGSFSAEDITSTLISGNAEIYAHLLNINHLSEQHLSPLSMEINDNWCKLAKLALDSGYTNEQVATAIIFPWRVRSWSGQESKMWEGEIKKLDLLLKHSDNGIRAIGQIAIRYFENRKLEALAEEEHERIYGWDDNP